MLQLPITDLPALYESWTALTVCAALVERGEVLAQQLCAPLEEGWTLRLQRDRPILKIRRGGRVLLLRYQPRYEPYAGLGSSFGSLDRYLRIPDLSIEVRGRGERWLAVLDAKYRLAPDDHPPQDALDDIYAYKGSLGQKGVPLVRYAALLYPGHGLGEDYGGIGALPHLPGHTNALQAALDRLLNGS
ncbi:MAG: hypothetical protein KatS3mg057_1805 [Herpetosiphonaceae bacterium]|nr:MAG: hypothetical protein KatS3mg057_1805 [Herpetosiphonaceae bacterium]